MLKRKYILITKHLISSFIFINLFFVYQSQSKAINALNFSKYFIGKLTTEFKGQKKEGSGVIFIHNNSIFILSSNHVAMEKQEHAKFLLNNQNFKVTLMSSDWTSGLSLFSLVISTKSFLKKMNLKKSQLLTLNNFNAPAITSANKLFNVIISGFPQKEKNIKIYQKKSIIKYNKTEKIFLSGSLMIDLIISAKKGMSGGGTFYKSNNKWNFLGLNSNIYTKNNKNHLLIISSLDIKPWIKNVLQNKLLHETILGLNNLRTINGLSFYSKKLVKVSLRSVSGPDPIGIGGEIKNSSKKYPISVTLNLDHYSKILDSRLSTKVKNIFYIFQEKKLSNYNIRISYFSYNNQLYSIHSLNQFFKYLNLGYKPIAEVQSLFEEVLFKEKKQKRKQIAKQLQLLFNALSDKRKEINSSSDVQFLAYLKNLITKINSEEWFLVQSVHIEAVLNSSFWNKVYNKDNLFDIAVNLNAEFYSYKTLLPYLVIE